MGELRGVKPRAQARVSVSLRYKSWNGCTVRNQWHCSLQCVFPLICFRVQQRWPMEMTHEVSSPVGLCTKNGIPARIVVKIAHQHTLTTLLFSAYDAAPH